MRTLTDNWWKVFHDLRDLLFKPTAENIKQAAEMVRVVLHHGGNNTVYRIADSEHNFNAIVDTPESVQAWMERMGQNLFDGDFRISEWTDNLTYVELIHKGKRAFYATKATVERLA